MALKSDVESSNSKFIMVVDVRLLRPDAGEGLAQSRL